MLDKSKLGGRYVCFQCGTKFYDLNRPEPTCPECSADQRQAPTRDMKALLAGKGPIRRPRQEEEEEGAPIEEDEDLGLLDDVDDDEADLGDEEEEEDMGEGESEGEDDW